MQRFPMFVCVTFLALETFCVSAAALVQSVMVTTGSGTVIGHEQSGVDTFLGIPYAAPPVGALRFQPPIPGTPWQQPRMADHFGAACPQTSTLGTPSTNEDCLTLNVYRPSVSTQGRPVLVFFYGGSFRYGNAGVAPGSAGPDYTGNDIARRTGAIVVTVNYRLGALGFLAARALDNENAHHVSGNYGLLDQQAALRWVASNARAFGGDPKNVTVFGQSAGAVSIVDQMVSPGAAGLFERAQLESAGSLATATLASAEKRDESIVDEVGCANAADVAACLRRVPVSTFLTAAGGAIGPNVDGFVVPTEPQDALTAGTFSHIPVVEGSNLDEGTYFIAQFINTIGHDLTLNNANAILVNAFGKTNAAAIATEYALGQNAAPGQTLSSILTDEFFSCPAHSLRKTLQYQVPVIEYEFSQPDPVYDYPVPRVSSIVDGDAHTTELAYFFGHDGRGNSLSGTHRWLSESMIEGLGMFARYGLTPWSFSGSGDKAQSATVIELKSPIDISSNFSGRHRCDFWRALGSPTVLFP